MISARPMAPASHQLTSGCILHPCVIRVNFVNVLRGEELVLDKDSGRHRTPVKNIQRQLNDPYTIRFRK
jgi:hypothetical protein